jgi:hypothetical protein
VGELSVEGKAEPEGAARRVCEPLEEVVLMDNGIAELEDAARGSDKLLGRDRLGSEVELARFVGLLEVVLSVIDVPPSANGAPGGIDDNYMGVNDGCSK